MELIASIYVCVERGSVCVFPLFESSNSGGKKERIESFSDVRVPIILGE